MFLQLKNINIVTVDQFARVCFLCFWFDPFFYIITGRYIVRSICLLCFIAFFRMEYLCGTVLLLLFPAHITLHLLTTSGYDSKSTQKYIHKIKAATIAIIIPTETSFFLLFIFFTSFLVFLILITLMQYIDIRYHILKSVN